MESHLKQGSSHGIMAKVSDCSSCTIFEVEEEAAADDSPSTVGPLHSMSSLMQQLPNSKRGLSKHYKGKSQSFTSLDKVECLQDLVKPENPYNKRLKGAKSLPFNTNYLRLISKTSAGTYVVAGADSQPTVAKPRRTTSTSDFSKHQSTPLFA